MENKEIFDNNEFTAKTENTQPEAVQGATSTVQSQDYENLFKAEVLSMIRGLLLFSHTFPNDHF